MTAALALLVCAGVAALALAATEELTPQDVQALQATVQRHYPTYVLVTTLASLLLRDTAWLVFVLTTWWCTGQVDAWLNSLCVFRLILRLTIII